MWYYGHTLNETGNKTMSTNLKAPTSDIMSTRFWGGNDKGVSIQLTVRSESKTIADDMFDCIQMSKSEAALVAAHLLAFVAGNEVEDDS